jgi:hypothetical protein
MKQIYLLLATLLLVHVQVFGQSVPSYVPTNGLVGWWGFNGNAQDESGNGNHGTVNGATLTTDRFGNQNSAYSFTGNGGIISSPIPPNPITVPNFTINLWFNISTSSNGGCIITQNNPIDGTDNLLNVFYKPLDGQFSFSTMGNSLCSPLNANSGPSYTPSNSSIFGSWHMLTLVLEGNQTSYIYIDGHVVSYSFRSIGWWCSSQNSTLRFGGPWWNGDQQFFTGKLDDIGIWNGALTQQQITNLFCRVSLTTQPSSQTTGTNRNVQFSVVSSDTNSTYRWQTDMGFGFQDLYNAGQYARVNTSTLNVSNTSPHNDNQLFRCIVSTTNCGSDTSDVVTLNVNSPSTSTGVPNKFTYQSVVRDTSGQLVTNQPVGMRLSLQRGPQMTNLYTETHQLTTNSNGLLTTTIGSGQPTQGMMDTIDWSGGMVYVKTEIDMTGGSNYSLVSTRELLSVPYALYSLNSGSSTPGPVGPMGPQGPAGNDGAVGPQGPIGLTGPAGPQGPAGNDGAVGPQGLIGLTGPQGPAGSDGAMGPQGPIGLTGPQGPAGSDGAMGPQGPIGLTGPQGPAGSDGAVGPQGPIGLTGPAGPQGPAGNDGAVGPQGLIGLTGPAGPQGPAGNDGAVGPQGPIGLTGPAGPQGAPGNDGAVGPQGPQGIQGSRGPIGAGLTGVVYFMEPGTYNWTVPTNVSKIWVKCLGGGGAGGHGFNCVGGGGGSGGYAEGLIDVTNFTQLTITVGDKGLSGPNPTNGGLSSINNIVIAGGGTAGGWGSGGPGPIGSGGISSGQNLYLLNGSSGQNIDCMNTRPGVPKISMAYPSSILSEKVYGMGGGGRTQNPGDNGTSGFVIIQY